MASFVQGLELARSFYIDVIAGLLDRPHTAALIGEGSEVLGYDTERSTDHEWGPRMQLFVDAADVERVRQQIEDGLPETHRGYPTRWFSLAEQYTTHHIEVDTLDIWMEQHLPTIAAAPDVADWLAVPQQHLLQLTAGAVFADDHGQLRRTREIYRWYPDNVWRWMIAAQWHLIGNTEPFLGRSLELGDHRGARLHATRLCRLIMELCFLQERRYRPYDKWFSRAFADLDAARDIGPLLDAALTEPPASEGDTPLTRALLRVGERHNALGISEAVRPVITDFGVNINNAIRPYPVINSGAFIDATVAAINDPALRNLPRVGSIDQLTHADDLVINFTGWPGALAVDYRRTLES